MFLFCFTLLVLNSFNSIFLLILRMQYLLLTLRMFEFFFPLLSGHFQQGFLCARLVRLPTEKASSRWPQFWLGAFALSAGGKKAGNLSLACVKVPSVAPQNPVPESGTL